MKVLVLVVMLVVFVAHVDCQFWKYSEQIFNPFSWIRQAKTGSQLTNPSTTTTVTAAAQTQPPIPVTFALQQQNASTSTSVTPPAPNTQTTNNLSTTSFKSSSTPIATSTNALNNNSSGTAKSSEPRSTTKWVLKTKSTTAAVTNTQQAHKSSPFLTTLHTTIAPSTKIHHRNLTDKTAPATVTEASTILDTTTQEVTGTTEEPRDNHRVHDFYLSKREKPQVKIASNISQNLLPLPAGASAALVKPTKYHYYPHNQHIYLLPECAIQQVCNAVYVRLNWTQPLCACPSRYRDPCSASLNSDDQHTTELMTDKNNKRALTLVKTCEPTSEMRICRSPRDWSLLALQNIRTGKSHYLVICRCPDTSILEGPMSHDQPTYASVPGIRVYGMMCVQGSTNKRRGRPLRLKRSIQDVDNEDDDENPPFPWHKAIELSKNAVWDD